MSDQENKKWTASFTAEYKKSIRYSAYYEYFWSIVYASGLVNLLFITSDQQKTAMMLVLVATVHNIISTFIASRNAYLIMNAFSEKKDEG